VATRAVLMQHKTQRPVQFEITPATRDAVQKWSKQGGLKSDDFVFPSRIHDSPHLRTRQSEPHRLSRRPVGLSQTDVI
jgi:hypothetical protein